MKKRITVVDDHGKRQHQTETSDRADRLRRQLRENLKRRKAQSRALKEAENG